MYKIGVVAGNTDFALLAKKAALESKQDIIVRFGVLEEGVKTAKTLQDDEQVEALITRAPTGDLIKKNVEIPVIVMEITNFDLIRTFYTARQYGKKIVFIDFRRERITYDLDLINTILNMDVNHIFFSDLSETELCVKKAYQEGYEVIVTTANCMISKALELGIHGILVYTSGNDFLEAVDRAKATIDIRRKEREKNRILETIVNNSYEGTMTVDFTGKIKVFNNVMEKMLRLNAKEVIGTNITDLSNQYESLRVIYGSGQEVFGEVMEICGTKVALSRIPLYMENVYKGIVISLQQVARIQALEGKIRKDLHTKGLVAKANFSHIVGESECIKELKEKAMSYGRSSYTVLIYGESGTGKELFAQSIHNISPFSQGPFLAINCASLPENLLESELFGYEDGAFTGARKGGKIGLFEMAHGGSIFLDEIGEMSLPLQARLLRVLQEKEVIRLGGDRVIPINTRVICATNKDLAEMVRKGTFREDLFYRINVLKLVIPPLRERTADIPLIAREIIGRNEIKRGKFVRIPEKLLDLLIRYHWPGNVRELQSFIERLLVLAEGTPIDSRVFLQLLHENTGEHQPPLYLVNNRESSPIEGLKDTEYTLKVKIGTMEEMERDILNQLHKRFRGDKEDLAKMLGLSRTTLWRRFKT